jgi:hypothetical protein
MNHVRCTRCGLIVEPYEKHLCLAMQNNTKEMNVKINIDEIRIGDTVDVYFENSPCLFGVEVIGVPQFTGDAWKLQSHQKCELYYVLFYNYMKKL